jgi:hypothetical protein
MSNASALVALAMIGCVPEKSRAGKVTRVPPPATVLIAPPANAAIISPRNSVNGMPCAQDIEVSETNSSPTSEHNLRTRLLAFVNLRHYFPESLR